MNDKELQRRQRQLQTAVEETGIRIRRYTLDPRMLDGEKGAELSDKAEAAWQEWILVREKFYKPPAPLPSDWHADIEKQLLQVDRKADLIQRELISNKSRDAGRRTVLRLVLVFLFLVLLYLYTHGVRGLDFSTFEPLPEWGPLKYVEVAFWSSFGVLCWLLFLATRYLARRDFDEWYEPWYASTFIRAPFLTIILMMIVLEFGEWYGEGTWMETYLMEEGNKFYFIAFMSFLLGLASDETNAITRDLADGVLEFLRAAVGRVSERLTSAVSKGSGLHR